jgi:hypothetical protein
MMLSSIIAVMVIDTGYNPSKEVKHRVVTERADVYNHGTVVVDTMLKGVCSNVIVYMCGYTFNLTEEIMLDCLNKADQLGVKFINISYSGSSEPSKKEKSMIKKLVDKGVKFTLSSGNDSIDLDKHPKYPQNYAKEFKNIYVVGGKGLKKANTGSFVIDNLSTVAITRDGWIKVGTSFSAPRYMNKLLKQECKQ